MRELIIVKSEATEFSPFHFLCEALLQIKSCNDIWRERTWNPWSMRSHAPQVISARLFYFSKVKCDK